MPSGANDTLKFAYEAHQAGNLAAAEQFYQQALAQSPGAADVWHSLGVLYLQTNRPAEAIEVISRAIQLNPTGAEYFSHLGAAYGSLGRHEEAISSLRHAVRLAPQAAMVHYNLGTALRNGEHLEEAVVSFRHATAADPQSSAAHFNLANTLRELGQLDEAETSYRDALAARPGYVKALINLGNVQTLRKQYDAAIATLRSAVAAEPGHVNAHVNLGTVLRDARRFDEAVEVLRTAVSLGPESAEAHNALGTALHCLGQMDESLACCERALQLNPELADAHFSRAIHYFHRGDLASGFAEYEWRWKCKSFSTRQFDRPRWDGGPLAGRTILLHAEQGLGDAIHFVRYAADVKRAGGTVLVECPEALIPLFAGLEGIDRLVPRSEVSPRHDVHCPLMSLPGVLELSKDELARGAYLSAEGARVDRWRAELADLRGFRVGICWQGNPEHLFDRQRSFPLRALAPIARTAGVRLVSLQKGFGADQVSVFPFDVVKLGDDLDAEGAFVDTAAVMKNLDLIITTDTAPAHVAGALGVPVWVAVSANPDWRWFAAGDDTPWYPTMRLFRQLRLYEWDDVFERMAAELAELAAASV